MTLQEIYELAVQCGIENDFRSKETIDSLLARRQKQYDKMSKEKKEFFDAETLTNPYGDVRLLTGDPKKKIKKVLTGIDMEIGEVMLAQHLGDIDLIITHHPEGESFPGLSEVMELQVDTLVHYGVPVSIAESLLNKRRDDVARRLNSNNHYRAVDSARLLDIPMVCVHTATDNMVAQFVREHVESKSPEYVEDIIDALLEIPEYAEAQKKKFGPRLVAGKESNRCGKIAFSEITGGTEGSKDIYKYMTQSGIGTVVGMHMSDKHVDEAQDSHINAVLAGHMSSDSIGMNLYLDKVEANGVEIVATSGLMRVSRNK